MKLVLWCRTCQVRWKGERTTPCAHCGLPGQVVKLRDRLHPRPKVTLGS